MLSVPPPAANGTTMRIGFVGHDASAANADTDDTLTAHASSARANTLLHDLMRLLGNTDLDPTAGYRKVIT